MLKKKTITKINQKGGDDVVMCEKDIHNDNNDFTKFLKYFMTHGDFSKIEFEKNLSNKDSFYDKKTKYVFLGQTGKAIFEKFPGTDSKINEIIQEVGKNNPLNKTQLTNIDNLSLNLDDSQVLIQFNGSDLLQFINKKDNRTASAVAIVPVSSPSITDPSMTGPSMTGPPIIDPSMTSLPKTDPSMTGLPITDPSMTGLPITDPSMTGPPITDPSMTGPPITDPSMTGLDETDEQQTKRKEEQEGSNEGEYTAAKDPYGFEPNTSIDITPSVTTPSVTTTPVISTHVISTPNPVKQLDENQRKIIQSAIDGLEVNISKYRSKLKTSSTEEEKQKINEQIEALKAKIEFNKKILSSKYQKNLIGGGKVKSSKKKTPSMTKSGTKKSSKKASKKSSKKMPNIMKGGSKISSKKVLNIIKGGSKKSSKKAKQSKTKKSSKKNTKKNSKIMKGGSKKKSKVSKSSKKKTKKSTKKSSKKIKM